MSSPVVRSHRCHYALSHLRQQGDNRNFAPPVVVPALQSLPSTPYQCQLSSHPSNPHPHFHLTKHLWLAAPPLCCRATLGSLA
jgi:hypothetical protein